MDKAIIFNINDVVYHGLDGVPIQVNNVGKSLGDFIYVCVRSLEYLPIAQAIFAGKPIEISAAQALLLSKLVQSDECHLVIAVKLGIAAYIAAKIEEVKNG